MARKSIHLFILLSLLFACLDIVFVLINYRAAKQALDDHFTTMSREVETAFFQALDATEQRMLQIATFIANEPPVQRLFLAGKRAVAREGDSGTGRESVRIRRQLYDLLSTPRVMLARKYDFRQLQFHLGPGSLSFLRVHEPDRFGDRMDNVRHTVVAVNRLHKSVSGIETGRTFTGIRGVVPVSTAQDGRTAGEYIGALEAGTGFKTTLNNAVRGRKTNMAVLLTTRHMEKNVWPDVLESFFAKRPPLHGYSIEETTSPQIMAILDTVRPDGNGKAFYWQILDTVDPALLLIHIPLRDFTGRGDSRQRAIGTVVAWKPVASALAMFHNGVRTNILYALFGFLVTELLLYGAFQVGVRKLEHLIEDGRRELARTIEQLRKNERKFKAMAEFSVDWDVWYAVDGQAVYITPSCEEITGYPRDLFYTEVS